MTDLFSAIRRRRRRIAERIVVASRTWGYASLADARSLTPGFNLPPLRGSLETIVRC